MKNLNRGRSFALGLALIAAGLAAPPALSASAAPAAQPDPSIVEEMRNTASGGMSIRENPATGKVGFARGKGANPDLLPGVAAEGRPGAIAKADRYLDRFARAFGARPGELKQTEVRADRAGWSITFTQAYRGVPVFGAELKARVDREGDLTSVNGFAAPVTGLSTTPGVSKEDAAARALAMVRHRPAGHEEAVSKGFTRGLKVRHNDLMVYKMGSPRGIGGPAKLAWVLEVWNKATVRETVILDAQTGKYLNRWSMMAHALDRELFEGNEDFTYTHVYSEGDAFPGTLTEDQQNEILGAGETYWMFRNTFGYKSWDGNDGTMFTTNNDPRISCPNANWNGFSTNYCTGVTGDDTVAHEWGHAYTETTSGLIYQWQAGAMNEAYSDIWGEVVDMLNTRHNEGGETPDDTVLRTEGNCSQYTRHEITMEITAPASVAGPCVAAPASFGPVITETGVTGTAIVGVDGTGTLPDGTPDTSTGDGCLPFENAGDIAGQWVYVDRGTCTFATKAQNADDAGAVGIVVGNHTAGQAPFSMSGSADIYGVMVSFEDGQKFKSAGGPVTFDVAAVPSDADDSYRWLSGESDPAFGGAIRDMWNPNCYGDPGKVSDEEYHCSTDDSGGVHSNSGVVNRAFAIMVDGLPGKVTKIGLDKAAWLFWHSQINYLTPTSYFPDLADALNASCLDLQGIKLDKVTLGNPSDPDGSDGGVVEPEVIEGGMTDADCGRVKSAITETELRLDPTDMCEWEPLLKPGAPALECGDGLESEASFEEDFEDGLAGWTQDEELTFPEGHGYPWEASTSAPSHDGGVAYAPDPVEGDCAGGANDISSRNGLISPDITVPDGESPRMSFDHYIATEAEWDGANVKVSVNGGDFEIVPNDAYLWNAPGAHLAAPEDGNTNPMAGEPGWTGTDGGELKGSWGTSVIDLGALAAAGDTVNFRFDMGRDGCNGVDGWYVDNVVVESCVEGALETNTNVVKVMPHPVVKGTPFMVKVKVTADGDVPTGRVVLKFGKKNLGRDVLNQRGVAKIKVFRIFGVGRHDLVAKYRPTGDFLRSKDQFTIRVVRR